MQFINIHQTLMVIADAKRRFRKSRYLLKNTSLSLLLYSVAGRAFFLFLFLFRTLEREEALFLKFLHPFLFFLAYPTNDDSLSGSETDVCSSNENLSQEDRYVICNTLRQEPQGQENHPNSTDSSYNTLIIHGTNDERR